MKNNLIEEFTKSRKNLTKSKEEIQILQTKKIRDILQYSYFHSKYYRKTFQENGINDDNIMTEPLSSFPCIRKKEFMDNFNDIVTTNELKMNDLRNFDYFENSSKKLFKNKYHVVHSSGSTGQPMYFVYDEYSWSKVLIGIIRAALWGMGDLDVYNLFESSPKVTYIAATDGRYGGAMAVGGGIEKVGGEQLFLDINTPLKEWEEKITKFDPNIIIGYPSAIKILADLKSNGKISTNTTRIISCGEPLNLNLRKYFESVFNSPVINIYGASESLALGVDTGESDGMVLFDDLNYIEIENNEMYLTSLYNYTQPIIRYKISDKLVKKESNFIFSQAEILLSRNENVIWFEDSEGNKDFIHPLAIEGFCIEGMIDYQFKKTSKNKFEVLIETTRREDNKTICYKMKRFINQIILEKKMEHVDFDILFVDEILPNPKTGKKELIIDNISLISNVC